MNAKFVPPNPPIRATPTALHRRQTIWQVWVPLIVSIIVVLALAILAVVGAVRGSPQVEHWGNISAVLVILPVLLAELIIMAVVGGIAFGVIWLHRRMPGWLLKVQLLLLRVALVIRRAADAATRPVVTVSTFSARVSTVWNNIFHRSRRPA